MEINRATMFGKLNPLAYKGVESATTFCKLRGNPYVELVHWLHQILQNDDSDLHHIIKHFDLDPSKVAKEMTTALDRLPRGATSISDLSEHLMDATKEGWMYGTLLYNDAVVRMGYVIIGMIKSRNLSSVLYDISPEFRKVNVDQLSDDFAKICGGSPEEGSTTADGTTLEGAGDPGVASDAMAPAQMGKGDALKKFCVNLTERARNGELDPIVGRDDEMRQIVDILLRRRQNNPILTGEAGVGKTAVVEGFAQRLIKDDVPVGLKGADLLTLDMGLLQAGASMKGEFENRLKQVIDEVHSSEKQIILFIDEAHTMIGAGGAAGQNDAANLLKPALARGTLRTIAATTWAEYKKFFEKDPALSRRFQNIQVDEPDDHRGLLMMRGIASSLEKHHQVQILDEALEASVTMSRRYIPARQLPDKSVSVLDTACARVRITQASEPARIEDAKHAIESLKIEQEIVDRENSIGIDREKRVKEIAEEMAELEANLETLTKRWMNEKELVEKIIDIRAKLREGHGKVEGTGSSLEAAADEARETEAPDPDAAPSSEDRDALMTELKAALAELEEAQGEDPLVLATCDLSAVSSVIADWTGIPVGRMVKNQIEQVLHLDEVLEKRVKGQDHVMQALAKRIQTSRASLDDPNKPIGVFMLVGPSGTGKTETALALAEAYYGGEQNLITINMSEFQESHTVSTLKGAPPGYVGYGEGGVLTEAVRRKPYSVVLLDEIEKAHPDVHKIFFQVFDKGMMEDGEGRLIDFKNTIILMTSNVGSDLIMNMCSDPELMPDPDGINKALREPLLKTFPAALLGRIVTIPYYPLGPDLMKMVINLKLGRIVKRVKAQKDVDMIFEDDVVDLIAARCNEVESGGRVIDALLTNTVLPTISRQFLEKMMVGEEITKVTVKVAEGEFAYEFE